MRQILFAHGHEIRPSPTKVATPKTVITAVGSLSPGRFLSLSLRSCWEDAATPTTTVCGLRRQERVTPLRAIFAPRSVLREQKVFNYWSSSYASQALVEKVLDYSYVMLLPQCVTN